MKLTLEQKLIAVFIFSSAIVLVLAWGSEVNFFYPLIGILTAILLIFFATLYINHKKRNETETLLKQNEEILQHIIDNTTSIIYTKDLAGRFTLANKQFQKSYKLPRKDIIGKTVFDICEKYYAVKYSEADDQVMQQKKLIELEEDALINGKLHHFYSIKFPLYKASGEVYGMGGISTDITNIITRQQLHRQKEIAETTILAQEKERTEIGKELHDNVNQLLATARLMIETARRVPEMQDECSQKASTYIEEAINEVRVISHSMMPPSFENDAFVDALRDISSDINISGNMLMNIQVPKPEDLSKIANNLKLSLYRIIQEQVSNILKYSQAKSTSIILKVKGDDVHLAIVDNGIGADLKKQPRGIGLKNIASRVALHNGELKIETAPNKGFALFTKFRINDKEFEEL